MKMVKVVLVNDECDARMMMNGHISSYQSNSSKFKSPGKGAHCTKAFKPLWSEYALHHVTE